MDELVPCDKIVNSTNIAIHCLTSSNNNIVDTSLINISICLCDTNAILYIFLQCFVFTWKINVIQNYCLSGAINFWLNLYFKYINFIFINGCIVWCRKVKHFLAYSVFLLNHVHGSLYFLYFRFKNLLVLNTIFWIFVSSTSTNKFCVGIT